MIKPVREDKLEHVWINGNWYEGFYLYVHNIKYSIGYYVGYFVPINPQWRWDIGVNLQRRSMDITLPGDDVAGSVINLLNKNDNTAGMPLLEYLTKMGFDVSHIGAFSRLKRWFHKLFTNKEK